MTTAEELPFVDVSNVLSEEKKQQVIALGRLGWPLRRIEKETRVRRETAAGYLKAAGIAIRPPGAWGRRPPAKPANEASTDSGADLSAVKTSWEPICYLATVSSTGASPKPANEVSPDSAAIPVPVRRSSASACEPYFDFIEISLGKGRNAKAIYQDLVDDHGFKGRYQSVKRFVRKLRDRPAIQACAVIVTAPGEDYGKSRVMLRARAPVASPQR